MLISRAMKEMFKAYEYSTSPVNDNFLIFRPFAFYFMRNSGFWLQSESQSSRSRL